jgi:hypothetical protein
MVADGRRYITGGACALDSGVSGLSAVGEVAVQQPSASVCWQHGWEEREGARGERKQAGRTQYVQAGTCETDWLTEPGKEGAAAPAAS